MKGQGIVKGMSGRADDWTKRRTRQPARRLCPGSAGKRSVIPHTRTSMWAQRPRRGQAPAAPRRSSSCASCAGIGRPGSPCRGAAFKGQAEAEAASLEPIPDFLCSFCADRLVGSLMKMHFERMCFYACTASKWLSWFPS